MTVKVASDADFITNRPARPCRDYPRTKNQRKMAAFVMRAYVYEPMFYSSDKGKIAKNIIF